MESLTVEYSIKKFASVVVIEYSKIKSTDPELISCLGDLMDDKTSQEIFKCINLLFKCYKDIVDEIGIKEFEDGCFLSSKRQFAEQLVSRCLKLSEGNKTFLEFLLVCVYICKFSYCIYAKYKCFKILKLTADCLETVYCREYFEYFQEHDGFQGLADFCRNLNCEPFLKNGDGQCVTLFEVADPELNKKVKKLQSLNDVDNVITLNVLEEKLIEDRKYLVSSHRDESADFLIDSCIVSGPDQDVEMKEWEVVPEKRNEIGLCGHCHAECSHYPKNLVNELKMCEIVRGKVRNY